MEFSLSTLIDVPSGGVFFVVFEWISNAIREYKQSDNVGMLGSVFAGGMSGLAFWITGMPPDVLKSRLQTAPDGTYPRGIRSVFKEVMASEGPLALYRGVTPIMIRAFPANGACFFGIEIANRVFQRYYPDF